MGISKDNIPDRIENSKSRAKSVSDIGDNFPIGVFVYSKQGTIVNWCSVWRMERSQDDKNFGFIAMCVNANKAATEYLSHRKTNDSIDTIVSASGSIKRLFKSIISAVVPYGCVPQFTKHAK